MKVKRLFTKKYIGYELFLYKENIDEDIDKDYTNRDVIYIEFYINKEGRTIYRGIPLKIERDEMDKFIEKFKDVSMYDYDIDNEYKQIHAYYN